MTYLSGYKHVNYLSDTSPHKHLLSYETLYKSCPIGSVFFFTGLEFVLKPYSKENKGWPAKWVHGFIIWSWLVNSEGKVSSQYICGAGWGRRTCSLGPQGTNVRWKKKKQVGHFARVRTERGGEDPAALVGPEQRVSRAGSLGGGTEEEQASRWGSWACSVPVSMADGVTKTILNSPKALIASSDRCYCPRQSNITVWIRRRKTTRREYR